MTVLDLIKKSAVILNIDEISNASLNTITAENELEVLENNVALKKLYELTMLMLNEIATYYMPIMKTVELNSVDKKIDLSKCQNVLKVVGVKLDDVFVKFFVEDGNILVKNDGCYTVIFQQTPAIQSLLDNVNFFDENVSEDLLVDGLNSYYCLACGLFKEFSLYNEKYSKKLANLRNLPIFNLPCRSWV